MMFGDLVDRIMKVCRGEVSVMAFDYLSPSQRQRWLDQTSLMWALEPWVLLLGIALLQHNLVHE